MLKDSRKRMLLPLLLQKKIEDKSFVFITNDIIEKNT